MEERLKDSLLAKMYSVHHREGKRLRQSFLENKRGELFSTWIGKGMDVLDIGCRDGTLTRHYVEGNRVTGCDIDRDALEHAKEAYGIEVKQADLNTALPFPDGSFDVVVMAETLEHLPYPRITLSEIRRVLRDGGILIGNVPLAYHLKNRLRVLKGKKLDYDPTHCQYFSCDSLGGLLSEFFELKHMIVLKGEKWAWLSMSLFSRNVAFKCIKRD